MPTTVTRVFRRWLGRRLTLACLLALALLQAHQAVMSSERHATSMAALHERLAPSPAIASAANLLSVAESGAHRTHHAPRTALADCLNQQAILPLLLLMLVLLGVLRAVGPALLPATGPRASAYRLLVPYPPPLASARRRALLQVFLN